MMKNIQAVFITCIVFVTCPYIYGQLHFNTKDSIIIKEPFNNSGLYIAERRILYASFYPHDTVYYHSYFPEIYLSQYTVVPQEYPSHTILITNQKDTLPIPYNIFTPEDYIESFCPVFFIRPGVNIDSLLTPDVRLFLNNFSNIYVALQGLMDKNGNIIQPLLFDIIISHYRHDEGELHILPFVSKNKVGFMDSSGAVIIPPVYDNLYDTYGTIQSSVLGDGYRSETDAIESYRFINGICEVMYKGKLGIINTKGEVVIPFIYKHITYQYFENNTYKNDKIIATGYDDKVHIFDLKGNKLK